MWGGLCGPHPPPTALEGPVGKGKAPHPASPSPPPLPGTKATRAPACCHKGPPATQPPLTSWGGRPALELTSSGPLLRAELREAQRPSCPVWMGKLRAERGRVLAKVTERDAPKG